MTKSQNVAGQQQQEKKLQNRDWRQLLVDSIPLQSSFITSLPAWPALFDKEGAYVVDAYLATTYCTLATLYSSGTARERVALERNKNLLNQVKNNLHEEQKESLAIYETYLTDKLSKNNSFKMPAALLHLVSSVVGWANSLDTQQNGGGQVNTWLNVGVFSLALLSTALFNHAHFSAPKFSEAEGMLLSDMLKEFATEKELDPDLQNDIKNLAAAVTADYQRDSQTILKKHGVPFLISNAAFIQGAVALRELSSVLDEGALKDTVLAVTILYSALININNVVNNSLRTSEAWSDLAAAFKENASGQYKLNVGTDAVAKSAAFLGQCLAVAANLSYRSANLAEAEFSEEQNQDYLGTIFYTTLAVSALYGVIYMANKPQLEAAKAEFKEGQKAKLDDRVEELADREKLELREFSLTTTNAQNEIAGNIGSRVAAVYSSELQVERGQARSFSQRIGAFRRNESCSIC